MTWASKVEMAPRRSVAASPPPDADLVRAHLGRILRSPDFAAAPQLSNLLEYIVERKLAGEEGSVKAYTIATEALGRGPEFDPQSDPIVRVQARRLRQSLQLYYAGPGASETMRIVLPVGAYVPHFIEHEIIASTQSATTRDQPIRPPMFPTPWVGPVALVLSILSIIVNVMMMWPWLVRVLGKLF